MATSGRPRRSLWRSRVQNRRPSRPACGRAEGSWRACARSSGPTSTRRLGAGRGGAHRRRPRGRAGHRGRRPRQRAPDDLRPMRHSRPSCWPLRGARRRELAGRASPTRRCRRSSSSSASTGRARRRRIAKLAHASRPPAAQVLLAAADTFRAAAIEQLQAWAGRIDVPVVAHAAGADPSAVVYDAMDAAAARGIGRRHRRHRGPAAHEAQPHG